MRNNISALLVCVFSLVAAAADKPRDLLVGKWEATSGSDKGIIVEYKADGTITATKGDKTVPTAKYKFLEDDLILVNVKFKVGDKEIASTLKYRIKVTKDELTTTDEQNKESKQFKRVK